MATRQDYINLFSSTSAAIEFETATLQGDDHPDFVLAVKRDGVGVEPDPRYWDWLIEQFEGSNR